MLKLLHHCEEKRYLNFKVKTQNQQIFINNHDIFVAAHFIDNSLY